MNQHNPEPDSPINVDGDQYEVISDCQQLAQALLSAQRDVLPLVSDRTGGEPGDMFGYVSAESIIDNARSVLLANNLVAMRGGWSVEDLAQDATHYPQHCMIRATYHLLHAPSGECLHYEVHTFTQSSPRVRLEQAISACLTRSLSYWLRDLLLIPRFHVDLDAESVPEMASPEAAQEKVTMDKARKMLAGLKTNDEVAQFVGMVGAHGGLSGASKKSLMEEAAQKSAKLGEKGA